MLLLYSFAEMAKVGNSWLSDLIGAIITVRLVILIFIAVLAFFVTFPPVLLIFLVLGLVYSVYRIVKDWKTARSRKLT